MDLQFRTETLPVESFTDSLLDVCGCFDPRPSAGKDEAWGGVLGFENMGLDMALVATDMQQILRTSKNIRQDDGENYFLIVQEEGRALMGQDEKFAVLHPGDMALIDSARPSEFTFFGDRSRQISLHLPRVDLEERFGPNIPGGVGMTRNDPTAMAIHAIIAKSRGTQEGGAHLQEALLNLVGVFLLEHKDSGPATDHAVGPNDETVLGRAIAYVETRFRDPDFAPHMIAQDLGIPTHHVQRGFKSLGTTATKYLLAKRLEFARQNLLENAKADNPILISTIAFRSGFSDISYFNRRFREVFGKAPGEYR